jgi:hypothetical protein
MQTVNETSPPETNNNNPTTTAALEQENNRLRANLRTLDARCNELEKWSQRLSITFIINCLVVLPSAFLIYPFLPVFISAIAFAVIGCTMFAVFIADTVVLNQIKRKIAEADACRHVIESNANHIDAIRRTESRQDQVNQADSARTLYTIRFLPTLAPLFSTPAPPGAGENAEKLSGLELNIPDEFICPLSFQIMTNPVYVNAHPGQRFERSWIEYHLREHNDNPLNREPLSLSELSDDTTLKNQIDAYVEEQLAHASTPAMAS